MSYDYVIKVAKFRTLKRNQNFMMAITGGTGSGKSYTGMAISFMVDDTFDIDRVVFSAEKFIEASNQDLPRGSVVMFDEAGIDASSRDWYSDTNKAINQVVETFRRDNLVCIFTTPVLDHLDKKVKAYFHARAEVLDPSIAGWGAVKFFNMVTDSKTGSVYSIYPKIKDDSGRVVSMQGGGGGKPNMRFPNPKNLNPDLVKAYEKKKKKFTEKVKQNQLLQLKKKHSIVKWRISQVTGHLAHNMDVYGIKKSDKAKKIYSRVYAKVSTIHEELKVTKADVKSAIEMILDNPEETQALSKDPYFDKKKSDKTIKLDRNKHHDIIVDWRKEGFTHHEIADKLSVPFSRYYTKYRKWLIGEELGES